MHLHGLTEIQMVTNVLETIFREGVRERINLTSGSAELIASLMKTMMKKFEHCALAKSQLGEIMRHTELIVRYMKISMSTET